MMLSEETAIADAAWPVAEFRAHLRLGSGFAGDDLQGDLLIGFLRAALAAIEARTGRVLLIRDFAWRIGAWRDARGEPLPLVPVVAVNALILIDGDGGETPVDPGLYRLVPDDQLPLLRPSGMVLPVIPTEGAARLSLRAGMAAGWDDLPADLGQAVLLLAAHYYEYRAETTLSAGCMPFGVNSLIERYRRLRFGRLG
ncbi:head-tail connector protein [Pseudodonghicola flavimaris]|uniref:Head-tail connector protein n=1 Tax=Pseudodonghicola flavimaris TaxID=3050036 RepID=A0ABT7F3U2_9RHOB|nr:head-tail connector protein [Pseudodonghicola flavimaris]MDK3019282.1 head-tail connector protein [Pseudodonghicola flavimaris]